MLNILKNTINRVFASGVDSDASAFITATGLSGTTQKSAITTLVKDLKSSGLWSKMKAVYPMVTDNYNLLSYTEDFSNGVYTKLNTSITTNSVTAPNGTLTGDKLIENTTNDQHIFFSSNTAITGQVYTFSAYLKAAEMQYGVIQIVDSSSSNKRFTVLADLVNGTIVTTRSLNSPTNTSSSITSVGNGWYRVTCTMAQVGGTTCYTNVGISNSSTPTWNAVDFPSYAGTNGNGIYVWGLQCEQSSTASTYQPILTTPSAFMASQMKYNLKDARDLDAAFRLTWSGGWTYSSNGATTNGTNSFADTKLNPLSTLATSYPSFGVYWRNTFSTGQTNIMGCCNTTTVNRMDLGFDVGVTVPFVATSSNPSDLGTGTSNTGYICATRQSANVSKLFRNGAILINGVQTFTANPNFNFYLAARNEGGTTSYYSNNQQIAFAHIGNSLTDQDTLLLNQIVEKYQVALSRGVQAAQSFYYNSAYSNEANTYLYSTQITGTTQVSAINTLINGLKANNLWSKMKAVYPFVTDYRNILSYTEDFTNGYWPKYGGLTITGNTILAPNGTLTADTVNATAGSYGGPFLSNNGVVQTYSCYVKKKTDSIVGHNIYSGTDMAMYFNFDTETIVHTIGPISNASFLAVGNGWYRLSFTFTNAANATIGIPLPFVFSGGSYIRGTDVYVWGAQLENGTQLTPYQPVLGANSSSTFMSSQMKFNLVNPQDSDAAFRLAFSGGWTYSTNGAQPNGTNGYADTKLNQTAAGMFTNSHLSYYSRTNSTTATAQVEMGVGATVAGTFTNLLMRLDTVTNYIGGSIGSRNALSTSANSNGHLIVNALSAAAKAFKNGVLVATDTTTQTGTLNTLPIYIGCQNNNSVAGQFSSRQAAFASIGDGLTDAEALILYNLIQQYQTDLSRQV